MADTTGNQILDNHLYDLPDNGSTFITATGNVLLRWAQPAERAQPAEPVRYP